MSSTNRRKSIRTKKMVATALMAALTCIATLLAFPAGAGTGFVHFGDCFVILGAYLLGPLYGSASAVIGSCLADCILGYSYYSPATAIIKCLMALLSAGVFAASRVSIHPIHGWKHSGDEPEPGKKEKKDSGVPEKQPAPTPRERRIRSLRMTMNLTYAGCVSELVMILGYYVFDLILYDMSVPAALANVPGNFIQCIFGVFSAVIIGSVFFNLNIKKYIYS